MQLMGIEAIYARPNTSEPNQAHKIYSYLLKSLSITKVNQVWATHLVCADGNRLYVSVGHHRLIQPLRAGMVCV